MNSDESANLGLAARTAVELADDYDALLAGIEEVAVAVEAGAACANQLCGIH